MIITDPKEKKLIENYRTDIYNQKILKQKQATCSHDFRYSGHSHNDDCYECVKCGKIEWR